MCEHKLSGGPLICNLPDDEHDPAAPHGHRYAATAGADLDAPASHTTSDTQ